MSYETDDGQTPGQSLLERELVEDVVRAHKIINRYMNQRQRLALRQSNPDESAKLRTLLNDVDVSVLSAFDGLKPYCQRELAGKWMDTQVGTWHGNPVMFGSRHAPEARDDALYLDELRGRCEAEHITEYVRFEGHQERTVYRPALLHISAYAQAKDLLVQTLREADLAPQPEMPTYNAPEVLTHDGDE